MKRQPTPHGLSRRRFLQLGGQGALLTALTGGSLRQALAQALPQQCLQPPQPRLLPCQGIRLLATDGFMSLPGRRRGNDNGIYAFGFRGVLPGETLAAVDVLIPKYKFSAQWPSPILAVQKNSELYITMSNLGFEIRPDLSDAHSIHWHGFRNPNAIFDGVPEVSIAVPPSRDFPYYYKPRNEGTYMYHCHFEDTEHVQLGMDGVVYIEAATVATPFMGRAYDNDSNTTVFHRQFTLLLNEVDPVPHDGLRDIQEFRWSDYKAAYWLINGRAYPDTIVRDQDLAAYEGGDFNLPDAGSTANAALGFSQPVSSLIQVAGGQTALLRFVNLGYAVHAMQLLGPRMRVVGHDAVFLGSSQIYRTNTISIGPGEARDVLVTAPAYSASLPGGTDGAGAYNRYWLRNTNALRLINGDQAGLGGMMTQMRVYASLGPQTGPNKTL